MGDSSLPAVGVALDVVGIDVDDALGAAWRARVESVRTTLGWSAGPVWIRAGADAVTLGFAAPSDQLRTAGEANIWALCAALVERDPCHWSSLEASLATAAWTAAGTALLPPLALSTAAALTRFKMLAESEARRR